MTDHAKPKRKKGFLNYYRREIARKFLKKAAKEHLKNHDQLITFSFDHIANTIALFGQYEKNELDFIVKKFGPRLRYRAILDIGANIGNHTVAFSKIAGNVFAFEPNKLIFDVLKLNTTTLPNVQIFNFGASDADITINAIVPKNNLGGGTVASSPASKKLLLGSQFYAQDFELKCLESLSFVKEAQVGLIKIDVEGHELSAFKGLKSILLRDKPVILFEQKNNIVNFTSSEVEFLRSLGYKYLYELVAQQRWITPHWLPKSIRKILMLIEVAIAGEPSTELNQVEIRSLTKSGYNLLLMSYEKVS